MPVAGPMTTRTNNNYEDASLPRNTVHEVASTELLAVKYTDGYGKTQTRLVVMINDHPFLLAPSVSMDAKAGQKWFKDQIAEKILGAAPKKRGRRKKAKAIEEPVVKTEKPALKPMNLGNLG